MSAPEDLRGIADRFRYEVGELIATSRALSSERDIGTLLALILEKCRQVTGADAGSVYVLEGEGAPSQRRLHFMLSQNDSIRIDFKEFTLSVDEKSIVGKAVLDARPINIPDLDRLGDPGHNPWGFRHNKSFDEKTGYRARSMLTVPMLSAKSEVIGVVQSDRPYKKAVPIDRALGIIEGEVKAGKCDPDLFRVFVEAEIYKKVL